MPQLISNYHLKKITYDREIKPFNAVYEIIANAVMSLALVYISHDNCLNGRERTGKKEKKCAKGEQGNTNCRQIFFMFLNFIKVK